MVKGSAVSSEQSRSDHLTISGAFCTKDSKNIVVNTINLCN